MDQNNSAVQQIMAELRRIFDTSRYGTVAEVYLAQTVYALTLLIVFMRTAYALSVREWQAADGQAGLTMIQAALKAPGSTAGLLFAGLILLGIASIGLTRYGLLHVSRWMPLALWIISSGAVIMLKADSPGEPVGTIVFLIVIAALTTWWRVVLLAGALSVVLLLFASGNDAGFSDETLIPLVTGQIAGALGVAFLYLYLLRASRQAGGEAAMEDRVVTAEVITQIAERVAQRVPLDRLLADAVSIINARFDAIYHTQIFLSDETGSTAILKASTGEVGRRLLERQHRLPIGGQSVIGQVTLYGDPIVARVGDTDRVHLRNELLPDTQVEAAFPLRVGDRVIGALDLQSKDADAFNQPGFINTFIAFGDSLALAIDNLIQHEQAQRQVAENVRLVAETQKALEEVRNLNEQLTRQSWGKYLESHDEGYSLAFNFDTGQVESDAEMTPSLMEAISGNQLVQQERDDQQVIAVPLRIAGRVIGAMEFELDQMKQFNPEDLDLINEVSEIFGYAVENARLLDESQRLALREFMVGQVAQRIQGASSMESLLSEVAHGLQDVLAAGRVSIRLGTVNEIDPEAQHDLP